MAKKPKGFKQVSASIRKGTNPRTGKRYTKESADKIAAAAGRKNLGQKEMTRRSVKARKK